MRTITAYFDSVQTAEQAAFDLAKGVPGVRGQVFDTRNANNLDDLYLPEGDAALVREGFRRGGGVVHAEVPDGRFDEVANVLEASGAVDLDALEAEWRKEGWTGSTTGTATGTTTAATGVSTGASGAAGALSGTATGGEAQRLGAAGEERIPIIEERLRVGKREVGHGRVRIRSYVVETPVQEQVTLREERVDIERRPVDRPVAAAEDALFRERVIEATETAEEVVVAKEARVTEEVVIRKTSEERTETVSDTVRRTEVEVEDERTSAAHNPTQSTPPRRNDPV
jgi:uncharacterized protein (TIGR02271 family)